MFIAFNLDLLPGEGASAVTARAQDTQLNVYPLTVEFVGTVPSLSGVTEVIVQLPANLPVGQDVLVSLNLHGQTSNKARIKTR